VLKLSFVKKVLPVICAAVLIIIAAAPHISKMNNERIGRELIYAMYDFEPMQMIEQNEKLKRLLSKDIADRYLLSDDMRQLTAYLKFEMKKAYPVILYQDNLSIKFTIESEAMEADRIFQIDFKHSFGKITSVREFELTPIPPTGIWDYE
jgi:hypothetical protein